MTIESSSARNPEEAHIVDSAQDTQADQHAESQENIKSEVDELLNGLSEQCERLGIKEAAFLIRDPQSNQQKMYLHGHIFDVTAMLKKLLDHLRNELLQKIS